MSQRKDLDEVLDARAEIRRLRKEEAASRAAFVEAKRARAEAETRFESVMSDIESKQGRLEFPDHESLESNKAKRA